MPQRTYENDITAMQCSPLLYNLFSDIFVLRVVSRFKGRFIQSFSILYSFLIMKLIFDKLGCIVMLCSVALRI